MSRTKIIVMACIAVVVLGAAVAVKLVFFPSVKDAYFTMNSRSLQMVPANLVVIRPTHFAKSPRKGLFYANSRLNGQNVQRMLGRDMALGDLIGTAYNEDAAKVSLPPDAPKTNYDFVVTVSADPQEHLKTAIRKKLGLTADMETRETDVLAFKVEDAALPGLTVSDVNEKENSNFKNGRLYLTHMKIGDLMDGVQQMLKMPVVDKTGLTNFYDFSLVFTPQMQRGQIDRATVEKIIGEWGLGLEPDTAQMEMLVVKKVH
jgi:uncharacterized protein (TIGR03435 family)